MSSNRTLGIKLMSFYVHAPLKNQKQTFCLFYWGRIVKDVVAAVIQNIHSHAV